MISLGIETTCDETAVAIVRDGFEILAHNISSQIDLHAQFGGVVPELACRRHIDVIEPLLRKTLDDAKLTLQDIDLISVASGPGLIGALLIGITFAKGLAWTLERPLVGVNHVEAHLYASMMACGTEKLQFPSLGVVLSGGHTSLVLIEDIGRYRLLGETVDDAIGEAFDKVARMLELPYPGGPHIEALAVGAPRSPLSFSPGVVKGQPCDFSFSGMKTAVLYHIGRQGGPGNLSPDDKKSIARAFQEAAFSDVLEKIKRVLAKVPVRAIFFGGGVTQNKELRRRGSLELPLPLYFPPKDMSLDNGAMIAGLGFHVWKRTEKDTLFTLEPETRMPFERSAQIN
jgi:N6-L-threonylcarbamoyladenine synthase